MYINLDTVWIQNYSGRLEDKQRLIDRATILIEPDKHKQLLHQC